MRELRGSVHVVAIVASGLSPRDAVLAAGGADHCRQFGWPEPYPELDSSAKDTAEALTDTLLAGLYAAVLTPDEAAELVALVTSLRDHLG